MGLVPMGVPCAAALLSFGVCGMEFELLLLIKAALSVTPPTYLSGSE